MKSRRSKSGFTLVEMALVLVVIGLILGAVSIGKDMQRNAEYKKFKQKFVDQWVSAYNQHYDRMGYLPGDDPAFPTMTVYGLQHDDLAGLKAAPTAVDENGDEFCDTGVVATNILSDAFLEAGIALPPGRGIGSESRYLYLDSNGNPQQAQVCFQWLSADTSTTQTSGVGNVMIVKGLTPDLARFLDSIIDGQVDAQDGNFRHYGATGDARVALDWPAGNNRNVGNSADVTDVEQVIVINAALRMNQ